MFEVIVWDYDAAPDAESQYFVAKQWWFENIEVAKRVARDEAEIRVGAAVFCEFDKIAGFGGLTFDHPEAHLIPSA